MRQEVELAALSQGRQQLRNVQEVIRGICAGEVAVEELRGCFENRASGSRGSGDFAPHAHFLRSLSGKQQCQHGASYSSSSVFTTSRPR